MAKIIDPYINSQYVCQHIAQQMLNGNINSSSGVDINILQKLGGAWILIYALFKWRLILVKFIING